MILAPGQYAQIAAGALVGAAGIWFLARGRFRKKPQPLHLADAAVTPQFSQPTLISCGFILILIGYHVVIWTFPVWVTALQLNRQYWYIWFLIGILAVAASFVMDRFEGKSDPPGDAAP